MQQGRWTVAAGAAAWMAMVGAGLVACGGGGGGGTDTGSGGGVGGGGTGVSAGSVIAPAPGAPATAPLSAAPGSTGGATTGTTPSSGPTTGSGSTTAGSASDPPCTLFPPQAVFNTRIDDTTRFPAHASSAAWIASVGGSTPFRADWWRYDNPSDPTTYFGLPVNTVVGTATDTNWANVAYAFGGAGGSTETGWPHESDCAVDNGTGGWTLTRGCASVPAAQRRFPVPRAPLQEGGSCNDPTRCGDHHLLVVEQGACRLWEAYHAYQLGGQWYALSTAAWDLRSLQLRPDTWTAADAAGLPMTPLVARASDATAGEIRHALRVTFRSAVLAPAHVWPARHNTGSTAGGIPAGALLRLRADFVIPSTWSPQARAIATAAKRYGLYVADAGQDFYVQGEPDTRWDAALFSQLGGIRLSDMEFVDLGVITRDARFSASSMAASWP